MEQAGTDRASGTSEGRASGTAPWSAWEAYYRDASRRRRAHGGRQGLREEKRRRRWRERLGIGISALFVTALTAVFYAVLTR